MKLPLSFDFPIGFNLGWTKVVSFFFLKYNFSQLFSSLIFGIKNEMFSLTNSKIQKRKKISCRVGIQWYRGRYAK